MKIQGSIEDYLEAMLMMKEKHGYIRSVDIAHELGVTKPSVTYATKRLKESGLITMDAAGMIQLTPEGLEIATGVYDRHKVLIECLMRLGVSAETAEADACRIEHYLSDETYQAICKHIKKD